MLSAGIGRLSHRFYDALIVAPVDRDRLTLRLAQVRAAYERNTLNDPSAPTAGMRLRAGVLEVYGNDTYFLKMTVHALSTAMTAGGCRGEFEFDRYWRLAKRFYFGVTSTTVASSQKAFDTYAATEVMLLRSGPHHPPMDISTPASRSSQFTTLGIVPVWNPFGMFQLRAGLYCFMPWREGASVAATCRRYAGGGCRVWRLVPQSAIYRRDKGRLFSAVRPAVGLCQL